MGKRSGEAQAAQHRKAGPMAHKLKPRGGAKNDQPDLLEEAKETWQDTVLCMLEEACENAAAHRHDQLLTERLSGPTAESEYDRGAADAWDDIVSMLRRSV